MGLAELVVLRVKARASAAGSVGARMGAAAAAFPNQLRVHVGRSLRTWHPRGSHGWGSRPLILARLIPGVDQ